MKSVSIIIPVKNEERNLSRCLASIRALEYPAERIETIVVDNGSTDRTREIAASFGSVVLRDDTQNVSGLRNLGVQASRGEILAFVDADCEVAPDWLECASVYFGRRDVAAWGAPPEPPDDGTWVQKTWYLVRKKVREVQEVEWLESMNLFVRRDQFETAGGFAQGLVTCEDVDFSYRLLLIGRIVADRRIRVVHHGEAATLRQFLRKELWRGHSNWQGVRSHGWRWQELPSLALPLYFVLLLAAGAVALVAAPGPGWLAVLLLGLAAPSGIVLFRAREKVRTLGDVLRLTILLQFYFAARTAAVARR